MHECPVCGQACDCDGEDTWLDAPLDCDHDCDECDEVGFDDEFFDGELEGDDWNPDANDGDDEDQEDWLEGEELVYRFEVDDKGVVTLFHNLAFALPLTLVKGLGMAVEAVTGEMVWEVLRYASQCGTFVSFSQTFKELYEEAVAFKEMLMEEDEED